jgi:hypothetical protein
MGGEYTDLVDEWIEIRKAQQDEKDNAKKSINDLLEESEIARTDRHNLLLSRRTKRKRQKSSSPDTISTVSDAEDLLATQELTQRASAPPESPPKQPKRRRTRHHREDEFIKTFKYGVYELVKGGGQSSSETDKRLTKLEAGLDLIQGKISAIFNAVVKDKSVKTPQPDIDLDDEIYS